MEEDIINSIINTNQYHNLEDVKNNVENDVENVSYICDMCKTVDVMEFYTHPANDDYILCKSCFNGINMSIRILQDRDLVTLMSSSIYFSEEKSHLCEIKKKQKCCSIL